MLTGNEGYNEALEATSDFLTDLSETITPAPLLAGALCVVLSLIFETAKDETTAKAMIGECLLKAHLATHGYAEDRSDKVH